MKINNNTLAILIVLFVMISLVSTKFIVEKIVRITGVATVQTATVTINVSKILQERSFGSGVRGGGPSNVKEGFRIEPSEFLKAFSISTFVGEKEQRQMYIKNIGDLSTDVYLTSTLDIVTFDKTRTKLSPNEEFVVNFFINTDKPGLYAGKITVKGSFATQEIPIAITIRPRKNTFDAYMSLRNTQVRPGDDLVVNLNIKRAEGLVTIQYAIKDATNKAVLKATETRQVTASTSLMKRIRIPPELKPGTYAFAVEVQYKGQSDTIGQLIKVSRAKSPRTEAPEAIKEQQLNVAIPVAVLILIVIANIVIFRRKPTL